MFAVQDAFSNLEGKSLRLACCEPSLYCFHIGKILGVGHQFSQCFEVRATERDAVRSFCDWTDR
ncbi:hypothetical protein TSO5_21080 [Azospirillum sp. TSO5]|nr:hypothetical protein TSO5_21080 [Azospirillum sp. TSO5]